MKQLLGSWVGLLIVAGCAHAQVPAQAPTAAPAPATAAAAPAAPGDVDAVLDALDRRGKELSDFTAKVSLTDTDSQTGDETVLSGRIWMQRLPGDDARLRVLFDHKTAGGAPKPERLEYVLANGKLIDRDYGRRMEIHRQVLQPGQKMNLLKLGEGPFPLPLGQSKEDVHKMFEVKQLAAAGDDPAGTTHLQLKPRPATQFESKFATIDFWVDMQSRMPVKIQTQDPNQTTTRTTELKGVVVNPKLTDNDFAMEEKIDEKSWTIRQEAYEE
jgi:hypothetical protein